MKSLLLAMVFVVSNTNDDGAGSLRAAIEEANALCAGTQCSIEFRIPAGGPWQTIRVQRPLPPIVHPGLFINGTTQADTNPLGPDVELNGSALTEGSGLDFSRACSGSVSALAINGFPANGLTLGNPDCSNPGGWIMANYIGTDPTGTRAVPNTRGVWIVTKPGALYFHWNISQNVVSGNRYSGIFVASGPQLIKNNVIGLTAKRDADLGNGSSGVAILADGSGTDVEENTIGFNHHFGVAVGTGAQKVAMRGNSFLANWQLAIDWGMDGASPASVVNIPTITNVRFEDGSTIIEVESQQDLGTFPRVAFYANDAPDPSGYGEGQYFLGETFRGGDGKFVLRHPADLRGKWITATVTRVNYYGWVLMGEAQGFVTTTSEFSRAVEAK